MTHDSDPLSEPQAAEFAIIETDNGMTVVTIEAGKTAEQAALAHGGSLVDEGPFRTYEEACDAIVNLMEEDDERD